MTLSTSMVESSAYFAQIDTSMTVTYHRVVREDELPEQGAFGTVVNGWPVAVARGKDGCRAFIDKCTHLASRLSNGRVVRGMIQCPLHGARFDMTSGQCFGGGHRPLLTFAHRVTDGWIEVAIPDEKPGAEHQPARG